MLAASVVLVGGTLVLVQHGNAPVSYTVFHSAPPQLRTIGGIVRGAFALDSKAIVQLGLVLLIATPVVRVAFMLIAFVVQRDRVYAAISGLVLALLLYGLLLGRA